MFIASKMVFYCCIFNHNGIAQSLILLSHSNLKSSYANKIPLSSIATP